MSNGAAERIDDGSKYDCIVTFYHDVEQNINGKADIDRCRNALNEAIKIEQKYGVSATYNIVGKLFNEEPWIIDRVIRAGNEVAFHSFNHQNNWNPSFFHDEVKLCREMSSLPIGYRSPRSQWDRSTINALEKYNFVWTAENDKHGEPYFIRNDLMRLPISQDDWQLYNRKITFKDWRERFSSGIKKKNYYAIGTHDYILSESEDFIDNYEKLIEMLTESNVFIVSFMETVCLYLEYINSKKRNLKTENICTFLDNYKRSVNIENDQMEFPETYPVSMIDLEITSPKFPIMRNSISQMIRRFERVLKTKLKKSLLLGTPSI